MDALSTPLAAFTVVGFLWQTLGEGVAGNEAHRLYLAAIDRWKNSPIDPTTGFPINHHLNAASRDALREVMLVLLIEIAGRLEPRKPWIPAIWDHVKQGKLWHIPLVDARHHPQLEWLEVCRKAIQSKEFNEQVHDRIAFAEEEVCDLLTSSCDADFNRQLQTLLVSWHESYVQTGEAPSYFFTIIQNGWDCGPGGVRTTLPQLYRLFFREHIKNQPEVFRILSIDILNQVAGKLSKQLPEIRSDLAEFNKWLEPQLGGIQHLLNSFGDRLRALESSQSQNKAQLGEMIVAIVTLETEARRGNDIAEKALTIALNSLAGIELLLEGSDAQTRILHEIRSDVKVLVSKRGSTRADEALDVSTTENREVRSLHEHFRAVQKSRYDPLLYKFLQKNYPYPLLQRGGLTYPVFCVAATDSQAASVESVLGPLRPVEREPESYPVRNDTYCKLLMDLGKQVYNGRLYVMDHVHFGETIRIDCSLGWYLDALATCDALEWELLEVLHRLERDDGAVERLHEQLKLRNLIDGRVKEPCTDGRDRCAAISIATLIVFNDGTTDRALIRVRSGATAAHSDLYHVVPSFMMESTWGEDPRNEYSVAHHVLREYLEEVFGVEELVKSTGQLSHRWFYQHPQAIRLQELLTSGEAQLFFTGFVVNLLNLRPEICTLLVIRDPGWFLSGDIKTNWEFLTPAEALERRGREFKTIDVRNDDASIASELNRLPGTFVPPGAAAFWLGVDRARIT